MAVCQTLPSGSIVWTMTIHSGVIHRDDGPAVIHQNGSRTWYHYGSIHRLDGPAIEHANGECEWFINNRKHTFAEWLLYLPDDETRTLMMLRWSDANCT